MNKEDVVERIRNSEWFELDETAQNQVVDQRRSIYDCCTEREAARSAVAICSSTRDMEESYASALRRWESHD